MTKAIGREIFIPNLDPAKPATTAAFTRVDATALDLKETWYRDAIAANPELVISPCREAGLVDDEQWFAWGTEVNLAKVGRIDVLLVSSAGHVAIVETKLSYNPEKRREVVAQVLDYALALPELLDDLPALPEGVVKEDVHGQIASGELLLIIAGDRIDARALRLSQAMLANHLTSEWDLAMVDMNLYASSATHEPRYLLIPEIRGVVQHDTRQVVRVKVEGENPKAKVEVERITTTGPSEKWTEERLLEYAKQQQDPTFFEGMRNAITLAKSAGAGTWVEWGSGAYIGGCALRTQRGTLFYARTDGLQLYVKKTVEALGQDVALPLFKELGPLLGTTVPTDVAVPKLDMSLLGDDQRFGRFKFWVEKFRKLLVEE